MDRDGGLEREGRAGVASYDWLGISARVLKYPETTNSVVVTSSHNTPPHTSSVVAFHLVCCVLNMLVSGRRTFASTSARGADITLTVDGKEVTVPQGFLGYT